MRPYFIFFLAICFIAVSLPKVYSQNDLAIGQWRSYLPYAKGISVSQSPNKIYYATSLAFISVDKSDHSIEYFNKITGLSDIGIQFIKYDVINDLLLIAYANSNIDILKDGLITNVSDIFRSTSISGDKGIYHAYFEGNYAYLSCGFGIVQLDLEKYEVKASVIANEKFNASTIFNNSIYASGVKGLYRFPFNNSNFADFSNWESLNGTNKLPISFQSHDIAQYNGKLHCIVNDSLMVLSNDIWQKTVYVQDKALRHLSTEGKNLLLIFNRISSGNNELGSIDSNGDFKIHITPITCTSRLQHAIEDEEGQIWTADVWFGFNRYNPDDGSCTSFSPDGPIRDDIHELHVQDDILWVASGSVDASWQFQFNKSGIYRYKKEDGWSAYNEKNIEALDRIWDIIAVRSHRGNGKLYAGSFGRGLVEYDGTDFKVYGEGYLEEAVGDPQSLRISSLKFDKNNDLWILNYGAVNTIVVFRNDGTWERWEIPNNRFLIDITIDRNGYKWIINNSGGLVVFDENAGNPRYKFININNSALPSNKVLSIETDLNGEVWVGTNEGVVVFQCPGQIFDNGCEGVHKIVNVEGVNALLLQTESTRTIAIDGANRKWFGTENGIFVQSADGETQSLVFNTSNSPLFSNLIQDIEINNKTGEVFIGTSKGIISYRSDAISGGSTFASNVYAYPNPVRPEYRGPIAIKGLVRDANVKITDISGTMIYQTTANGGQAIWNGEDYNGNRAQSGVYLVFSTNATGVESIVTKILVMN